MGIEEAVRRYRKLGLTEWTYDTVVADGVVYGQPCRNVADLAFNYQAGPFELELLKYRGTAANNWHTYREHANPNKFLFSHKGLHVEDVDVAAQPYLAQGIEVAQDVTTVGHTNPYLLQKGRHYRYLVLDTRQLLGFDVKLISRLDP
jgi:hypothetical protein